MLTEISLKNFKSIEKCSVELGALTVLSGLNGSGKSSILQSIGLIKQSIDADESGESIFLKGEWVKLGRGLDVLSEGTSSEEIEISLKYLLKTYSISPDAPGGNIDFKFDNKTEVMEQVIDWHIQAEPSSDTLSADVNGSVEFLKSSLKGFQYIQADRLTPALLFKQASTSEREKGTLGAGGEFTVDYLSQHAEDRISASRRYPDNYIVSDKFLNLLKTTSPTDKLWDVTSVWLQLLSPGVRLNAESSNTTDSTSLQFEYKGYSTIERDSASHLHRATNVGFGLTYVLPIIVACLTAPRDSLVLLENPEAHLHPKGQAAMGLLLAMCASDGVQIIVETHSDHLLNGIRVAAKKSKIKADDVQVHFFSRDFETGITTKESPELLDNGRFSFWPDGFFDEWSHALDQLLED